MIPRDAEVLVAGLARTYPVVGITGPRQSGKTTLARHAFAGKPYVSLEDPDVHLLAESDPRGFLSTYRDGAVFDEAQRCPALFSYLQGLVDQDPRPGRFVLTGSQQFGLMAGVSQSLAGRIALLHLLPFTYRECCQSQQPSPDLDQVLYTGSYPPGHDRQLAPSLWYANVRHAAAARQRGRLHAVVRLFSFLLIVIPKAMATRCASFLTHEVDPLPRRATRHAFRRSGKTRLARTLRTLLPAAGRLAAAPVGQQLHRQRLGHRCRRSRDYTTCAFIVLHSA